MQNNAVIATVATTVSPTAFSLSILLDNPFLVWMAVFSGIIGVWNGVVFVNKNKISFKSIEGINKIVSKGFIGFFFAPILNIAFLVFGEFVLRQKFGFAVESEAKLALLQGFWMLLAFFSARALGERAMKYLKGKKNED